MNVIGHKDITPDGNIKLLDRITSVFLQNRLRTTQRRNSSSISRTKGYEVNGLIEIDQIDSRWPILDHNSIVETALSSARFL